MLKNSSKREFEKELATGFTIPCNDLLVINTDINKCTGTIVINCTPYGTASTKSPLESLVGTNKVYDLTFNGKELARQSAKVDYYSCIYFYKEVFLKQSQLYTGIIADPDMFDYFTTKRKNLN